ncbi:TetR/AcrR family transcriptional regulator [Pseudoneobacillus sp. C159]
MINRKQNVVQIAHKLFIEKGFQSTSIQDILDVSGISKGTFYNYFSSKNELLIAIFKSTYQELEIKRNELLIGEDRSDIEVFIKQIILQMNTNRENKMISLFEEVLSSNDKELKQFMETGRMRNIYWLYERFLDIFGEKKQAFLLDCAIMFMGILRENMKFFHMANQSHFNLERVIRYSINRIVKMVDGFEGTESPLIPNNFLDQWIPNKKQNCQEYQKKLTHCITELKSSLTNTVDEAKYQELLDFMLEELLETKNHRKFLIESAFSTVKTSPYFIGNAQLKILEELITLRLD